MTPFIIVLIAVPFVFWFLSRRKGRRTGGNRLDEHAVAERATAAAPPFVETTPPEDPTGIRQTEPPAAVSVQEGTSPLSEESVDAPGPPAGDAGSILDDARAPNDSAPLPHPEAILVPPSNNAGSVEEVEAGGTVPGEGEVVDEEPVVSTVAETPAAEMDEETPPEEEVQTEPAVHAPAEELHRASGPGESSGAADHQPQVAAIEIPAGGGQETYESAAAATDGDDGETAPSRYRPPPQRQQRPPTRTVSPARAARSESSLEIRVRLTLDRSGFCKIGLLPERTHDLDDEVTVKVGAMRLDLVSQEDWYSDLYFEDIGERLRLGLKLTGLLADRRRVQWQLKGRDFYVLAGHASASGFVSVPRLALGRSHVVLCTNGSLKQVEAILREAGCHGYTKLDESHEVPPGWTALRGVLPLAAIALEAGSDPFYAIKPAPDIEIGFEGGVRLHDSAWLAGYPPKITLLGRTSGAVKVLIDGKEALAAENCFTLDGYDLPGPHFVECEGLSCSRSYSIEEPADSWEPWSAYSFGHADICGPLVRLRPEAARSRIFTVSMSNPLLLGAEPGQVFRCSPRRVAQWKGFVPFDVVWALPAQPLICDKRTARILQFSNAPLALRERNARPPLGWCSAILDASRKGLQIDNASPDSTAQWIEYKKAARNIWRGRR